MSEIQVTSINGMGAITDLGGGSFSTTGMEANDHMHISEDFLQNAGIVGPSDFAVAQASVPGKKVTVSGGVAYVLNSDFSALSLSEQKYWRCKMAGDTDVTIADNTSGNPRIDIICIKVDPTATPDDEATNVATLVAVEGTPAGSPSVPTTPDDHLKLVEVAVANGFTSIVNANITDRRPVASINHQMWAYRDDVWTRTGDHTFTVVGDQTAIFRKCTRIRYKDGGTWEYGTVASSSYSSPNTTVQLIPNTDYGMAAAVITDKYISYDSYPEGYPVWFNYLPVYGSGGLTYTSVTGTAQFKVVADTITVNIRVDGTVGGTARSYIGMTIPVAGVGNAEAGAWITDSTTQNGLIQIIGGTPILYFYKIGGNFSQTSGIILRGYCEYQL